jgi:hypothetical protein
VDTPAVLPRQVQGEVTVLDNDNRILDKWRAKRGNKFLTLATAKDLEKMHKQYAHLTKT